MQVSVTARTPMSADQKRRAAQRLEALEPLARGRVLAARVRVERRRQPADRSSVPRQGRDRRQRAHRARARRRTVDRCRPRHPRRPARAPAAARRGPTHRPPARDGRGRARPVAPRRSADQAPCLLPATGAGAPVIRRKTLALEPMTPVEAAADMLDLDHDFYLFRDARSGADAVIHSLREDGRLGLIEPAGASPATDDRWLVAEPNRFSEPVGCPDGDRGDGRRRAPLPVLHRPRQRARERHLPALRRPYGVIEAR